MPLLTLQVKAMSESVEDQELKELLANIQDKAQWDLEWSEECA
jgi:hypothetical protein